MFGTLVWGFGATSPLSQRQCILGLLLLNCFTQLFEPSRPYEKQFILPGKTFGYLVLRNVRGWRNALAGMPVPMAIRRSAIAFIQSVNVSHLGVALQMPRAMKILVLALPAAPKEADGVLSTNVAQIGISSTLLP